MKRRRFLAMAAVATATMLAACGAPAQNSPAAAPAQKVSAGKPVFIDFYAPW